jgi:hypothetical protein
MIKSSAVRLSPLISGTINFFEGSILHAEELSTTLQPTLAKLGAHCKLVPPPALNKAKSGFSAIPCSTDLTRHDLPCQVISLPTDFSDATGINSDTGKLRSLRTSNILEPTRPVAPTTATFILQKYLVQIYKDNSP